LAENFQLDWLIAPTRVDDDLLDDLSDALECSLPASSPAAASIDFSDLIFAL
jgi:hypothetical protein